MPDDQIRIDDLPLFPLPRALCPGGLLPLRIFEVRYLDMVARAFRDGTPFGVVCLIEGSEVQQPARGGDGETFAQERFHDAGTLATISQLERPMSGLMVIRCEGTRRFRLSARKRLPHGLWTGTAMCIESDPDVPVPPDLAHTSEALRDLFTQLQAQAGAPQQLPFLAPYRWDDCGWVAHRWCELLPMPAALQQRLLETESPLLRLELVADMLDRFREPAPRREGPPSQTD